MDREIALYTLEGVRDAEITTHYFSTDDKLGLSMLRFCRNPDENAVLIVHGLTTSTDMFIMPEHENLVNYLLDNGYGDVWCVDFRMSNRHSYNLLRPRFTLDEVAKYDFPPAIDLIRKHIGDKPLHAIVHCLGSVSFMMSMAAKKIDGITSVISNSVALTPNIPGFSKVKLALGPFFVEKILQQPYVNPMWYKDEGFTLGKMVSKFVSLYHRECKEPSCHMLSFMWGTGWPAVYEHKNLADVTHRRGGDLYGSNGVHYYRHVRKMVAANNTAIKFKPKDKRLADMPDNYMKDAADIETPILFITGENNKVFKDSNIICHQRMEKLVPGRHELHIFPDYGHQDVFMGKDVAKDIFPRLLTFLNKHKK